MIVGVISTLLLLALVEVNRSRQKLSRLRYVLFVMGLGSASASCLAAAIVSAKTYKGLDYIEAFVSIVPWIRCGFGAALTAIALTAAGRGASSVCGLAGSFLLLLVWYAAGESL